MNSTHRGEVQFLGVEAPIHPHDKLRASSTSHNRSHSDRPLPTERHKTPLQIPNPSFLSLSDSDSWEPAQPSNAKEHVPRLLSKKLQELKNVNETQRETITELRIRVAVLEVELKNSNRDQDTFAKSLRTVVEALNRSPISSQTANSPGSTPITYTGIINREASNAESHSYDDTRLGAAKVRVLEREIETLRRANRRLTRLIEDEKGTEKPHGRSFATSQAFVTGNAGNDSEQISLWNQAHQAVSTSEATENFNASSAPHQLPAATDVEDVGLFSLEEIIGEEDRNEISDEHAQRLQSAMSKFSSLPKPGVIETGIELTGSFRGQINNHKFHRGRFGNHPSRGYNWFAPPGYGQRGTSSSIGFFDAKTWNSQEERDLAIEENKRSSGGMSRNEKLFPDFFKYGIKFTPGESDSNYMRSVIIENLPCDTELRDVIARVRGGQLVNAVLCDTMHLTGGMSAVVIFKVEGAAEEYANFCNSHPLSLSSSTEMLLRQAKVRVIDSPTYPSAIRHPEGTRCLKIINLPINFSVSDLERNLACGNAHRASALVEMWMDEVGTLHLQFSSVSAAGSCYAILTTWRLYGGLQVEFELDPCTGRIEELYKDPKPRPALFPKNRHAVPEPESRLNCSLKERLGASSYSVGEDKTRSEGSGFQRKQLAALTSQTVVVPLLSDANIKSTSWADEVIEEAETPGSDRHLSTNVISSFETTATITGEKCIKDQVDTVMMENLNELMVKRDSKVWMDRKPPVGLAGSKYATSLPKLDDRGPHARVHHTSLVKQEDSLATTEVAQLRDGLESNYQEDRLSLERELQAEFKKPSARQPPSLAIRQIFMVQNPAIDKHLRCETKQHNNFARSVTNPEEIFLDSGDENGSEADTKKLANVEAKIQEVKKPEEINLGEIVLESSDESASQTVAKIDMDQEVEVQEFEAVNGANSSAIAPASGEKLEIKSQHKEEEICSSGFEKIDTGVPVEKAPHAAIRSA